MQQFVLRAHCFADTARHRLDGAQAAWAARKYKERRVLSWGFLADMQAAKIVRGGNANAGLYDVDRIIGTSPSILHQDPQEIL